MVDRIQPPIDSTTFVRLANESYFVLLSTFSAVRRFPASTLRRVSDKQLSFRAVFRRFFRQWLHRLGMPCIG